MVILDKVRAGRCTIRRNMDPVDMGELVYCRTVFCCPRPRSWIDTTVQYLEL